MIHLRHRLAKGDFALDVDVEVPDTGITGVFGESGSGKSVSQMALMGLLPKTAQIEGQARYLGNDLLGVPDRDVPARPSHPCSPIAPGTARC